MPRQSRALALGTTVLAAILAFAPSAFQATAPHNSIRGFLSSRVDAERQLEKSLREIPDAAHAEANLRHLTSEPHMAGTEASHRVAEWLRAQYESYGFNASIVSYGAWLSQPKEISLSLIAPEQKILATPEQAYPEDKDTNDPRAVIGFNAYSASGDVTAPVVYANYGMIDDYRELDSQNISVAGKIVLVRYGKGYRGIKVKIAEEHKAAAVLIYSDPADDGYDAGDVFPHGPWRPLSGIQRGSVLYTEIYPGDPLTPGVAASVTAKRLDPSSASSLPRIPTIPINAQDAEAILSRIHGPKVPHAWQGGLAMTYHLGPGPAAVHLHVAMDYQSRPIYDVIAQLPGSGDARDEQIIIGNHHDAWVFGAVDPGSGTASMLETGRALGQLVRNGWKPRRTIVMCEWDAEEPGLIGSTEWVEEHLKELQSKAVAYINTDVGVTGPNFSASATPSLKKFIRDVTRDIADPHPGFTVYDAWKDHSEHAQGEPTGVAREEAKSKNGEAPVGTLGAGSDFCPFFDHAGIASMDLGFIGDYGVYHSRYDDFYWMKTFGDPTFAYHATLARIIGTLALRLDEADILPFDYAPYATDIQHQIDLLAGVAMQKGMIDPDFHDVQTAAAEFVSATAPIVSAVNPLAVSQIEAQRARALNESLFSVERDFLTPAGLPGRPWYKHAIYAPGAYAGYAAAMLPALTEAIDRKDAPAARTAAADLTAALNRATARLKEAARLAHP
jgi:N-acetylated-alpha-linked acidic dipeptidase